MIFSIKSSVIFWSLFLACYAQNSIKKRPSYHYGHHHHHSLWYTSGLFSYLTFLLIKAKVVFVIGAILTAFLFAGKLYALIKYTEAMKHNNDSKPEKIYIQAPSYHEFSHDSAIPYSDHSEPILDHNEMEFSFDKLPPGLDTSASAPSFERYSKSDWSITQGNGGKRRRK